MNKFNVVSILKFFYYLMPRFVRVQYLDSATFFRDVFLFNKNSSSKLNIENKVVLCNEIESLGADLYIFCHFGNRKNTINQPVIYIDNIKCCRPAIHGSLMDVTLARLCSVSLIGGTDAIIYNEKMYHQELMSMLDTSDLKQPDIFVRQLSVSNSLNYIVRSKGPDLNIKGVSISLLKEHSSNYYHCVTEILPRLNTILTHVTIDKYLSIIIDDCMPFQIRRMIEIMLSKQPSIQYDFIHVEKGQKVNCCELIYCTPLWLSLDNTQHLPDPKREFFVSSDGLKCIKDQISSVFKFPSAAISNKRKIYLQRPNDRLRKIANIIEVERVLYKQNFEFVNTGSLSFEEQYQLFSEADIVLGVSGASFTNLLFMKPNSKAVILSPSAQCTNYYIFQPLADVSEVELVHLLSKPDDDSNSLHGDASVNLEELELFLSEMSCDSIDGGFIK
ncbi:glycosyltransferase family 61 protein [Vibrio anguillarum]|nr:glycosyltransferase family 61 protein [Vibrio anguillarum]